MTRSAILALIIASVLASAVAIGGAIWMVRQTPTLRVPGVTKHGTVRPDTFDRGYVEAFARNWLDQAYTNDSYNIQRRCIERLHWVAPELLPDAKASMAETLRVHQTFDRTWRMDDLQLDVQPAGDAWLVRFQAQYLQNVSSLPAQRYQQRGVFVVRTRVPQPGDRYAVEVSAYNEQQPIALDPPTPTQPVTAASGI